MKTKWLLRSTVFLSFFSNDRILLETNILQFINLIYIFCRGITLDNYWRKAGSTDQGLVSQGYSETGYFVF